MEKTYTRRGWIRSIRKSKKLSFISATDGQDEFQLTIKHFGKEDDSKVFGDFKVGASFEAFGKDSYTPRGDYEFSVKEIKIVGEAADDFAIQPKKHSDDFLRTIPEERGRTALYQGVWRIRHKVSQELHRFFTSKDFIQFWTPCITSADCEGAGETFSVETDWLKSHLTVSGQLHGEVGMMSCGKIYTFGPCFRAEKSTGRRHLAEFWMLEPEMAFYSLKETMDLVEDLLSHVFRVASNEYEKEFEKMRVSMDHITEMISLQKAWLRMTYEEVCDKYGLVWGTDINAELERKLTEDLKSPVFITHWPREMKPFYMKNDGIVAECFDLIFPEVGELIGGSVREENFEKLKKSVVDSGIDAQSMDWYLKTRKHGTVPHAGFGLGFERLIMYICKLEKIQDTIPFPVSY